MDERYINICQACYSGQDAKEFIIVQQTDKYTHAIDSIGRINYNKHMNTQDMKKMILEEMTCYRFSDSFYEAMISKYTEYTSQQFLKEMIALFS